MKFSRRKFLAVGAAALPGLQRVTPAAAQSVPPGTREVPSKSAMSNGDIAYDQLTDKAPAVEVFRDRLHVFMAGLDQHVHHCSTDDGEHWSGWTKVGTRKTDLTPAIAAFKDRLWLFAKGLGGDFNIYHTVSEDGVSWTNFSPVPGGGGTERGISAAVQPTGVVLFAIGRGRSDRRIFYSWTDGRVWHSWQEAPDNGGSNVPMAATRFADRLVSIATGDDNRLYHDLNVNGHTFWNQIPSDTIFPTNAAPAPTVFRDILYVFCKGTDRRIYRTTSDLKLTHWSNSEEIPGHATTGVAPAAVVFAGKLYLFAQGLSDERRIFFTSFDGSSWQRSGWSPVG